MRIHACFVLGLGLCMALANPSWSQGLDTDNPTLPPEGVYLSPDDVHAMYDGPSLDIVMMAVQHQPFQEPPVQRSMIPDGEQETFHSTLDASAEVFFEGSSLGIIPVHLEGPVTTNVGGGYSSGSTGTYPTEMVAMQLSGFVPDPFNTFGPPIPMFVQESPSQPSLGQISIADIGGGNYHIDSFFDVFTEVSLDGGASWIPSTGSTHVDLYGIPEPASIVLMGLALIGLAGWKRHRV